MLLKRTQILPLAVVLLVAACCRPALAQERAMSAEDQKYAIALLREAYAAFNRDDIAAAVKSLDPQIEWTEPAEFPGGGTYHGPSEVAGYLSASRAGWAEGASEPEKFLVHDHRVVVFVYARFRLKGSDAWNEVRLADVYTFLDGTPIQMRAFADRAAALDWAGVKH
ncbi:MAG TPA: nuclear transport factor 2 family protein [Terracidiphilus sp.]